MKRRFTIILASLFRAHVIASYVLALVAMLYAAISGTAGLYTGLLGLAFAPLFIVLMLCQEVAHLLFTLEGSLPLREHVMALSYVLLLLLALWLPVRNQREHRRRLKYGLCLKCGYDLRATPDRCP